LEVKKFAGKLLRCDIKLKNGKTVAILRGLERGERCWGSEDFVFMAKGEYNESSTFLPKRSTPDLRSRYIGILNILDSFDKE
jgi:hypothetical protein